MITYFCDTNCDVTLKDAKELGFNLISMPYTINEKEIFPFTSDEEFNYKEFYDYLRNSKTIPTTSGLSVKTYINYFEEEFKKGNDICYFHFSGKMSGTFNAMRLAIEELKETYKDRKFYDVDLKSITVLGYAELQELSKLVKENNSIDEILDIYHTEIESHFALMAFSDDLKFFKKSGRLNGISATLGSLINTKPIISINDEGLMNSIDKAIGRKKAINKIIENIKVLQDKINDYPIYITHSDCLPFVEEMEKALEKEFGKINIKVINISPTTGVHCGPSCLGVAFHSKRRTL